MSIHPDELRALRDCRAWILEAAKEGELPEEARELLREIESEINKAQTEDP